MRVRLGWTVVHSRANARADSSVYGGNDSRYDVRANAKNIRKHESTVGCNFAHARC